MIISIVINPEGIVPAQQSSHVWKNTLRGAPTGLEGKGTQVAVDLGADLDPDRQLRETFHFFHFREGLSSQDGREKQQEKGKNLYQQFERKRGVQE